MASQYAGIPLCTRDIAAEDISEAPLVEREQNQLQRQARRFAPWLAIVGLVGIGVYAAGSKRAGHGAQGQTRNIVQLSQASPCEVPDDFCQKDPNREDFLSYRDCDGDGILDAYCEGGELLRFGFISSKNNCENNWPNGLCKRVAEPGKNQGEFGVKKAASNEVTIIHFNDVYEIGGVLDKTSHVRRGGMARAAHVIDMERQRNPDRTFAVFAGDLLSPSVLSDLFEGEQMVDILNLLKLDAASLGNHEFDFGVETMYKRINQSDFPWLNVNLKDVATGELMTGTTQYLIKDVPFTPAWKTEQKTTRVCFFGVAYDVRITMFRDKSRVEYVDIFEQSKNISKYLRQEKKCDVVLALSHQFSKDDCKLSAQVGKDVDLILGGHDHSTEMTTVCGHAPYVKADSDLKTQWVMTLWLDDDGRVESVDGRLLSLTDVDAFANNVHDRIVEWETRGEQVMGQKAGCLKSDLDTRATKTRGRETNSGNFFTDSIKAFAGTDVALFNGGAIRGDKIFAKGDVSKKTITEMHPFGNLIAKIHASGKDIHELIEHALRCYETRCGDFVQISGLNYTFNPSKPVGQRLLKLVKPNGDAVKDDDQFTLALSDYMLSSSKMKNNELYDMTTLNDAVPVVQALSAAVKKAADACIAPKVDGRITLVE